MKIRVSYGSAIKLGLLEKTIDCFPTTTYLMTAGSCTGECQFCIQAGNSASEQLSRVTWPLYSLGEVLEHLGGERVCIQCLNYPGLFEDVYSIAKKIDNPVSVSAQPFSEEELTVLSEEVERVGISLDCATHDLFQRIKPTYSWDEHWKKIEKAVEIFGPFKVSSHLIVGLGETEEEMVNIMQDLHEHKVRPSLFAFTPLKGTPMEGRERPSLTTYKKLQLAYHLITEDIADTFTFEHGNIVDFGVDINDHIYNPVVYTTRGCPGCNRPYYTESPRGPLYNYPYLPNDDEIEEIVKIWS